MPENWFLEKSSLDGAGYEQKMGRFFNGRGFQTFP
jgi:hypothetical protein